MKRQITSFILALLAVAAISTVGLAQTTNTSADGIWLYTVNDSNEATLVGITEYGVNECNLHLVDAWGTGYYGYLEIPATLGDYPLTGIGANAFYTLATSVPPGKYESHINATTSTWHTLFLPAVTRLEANALRRIPCRYVEFWSDTLSIGSNAFDFSPNLDTVWANNVTDIGFEGFDTCYEFRGFRDTPAGKWQGPIPSTVKSIGKDAFLYAKLEKQVSIPASLESVGYSAFQLSGVERLIIPSGVTCITGGAIQYSQIADALYLGNRENSNPISSLNIYRLPEATGWPTNVGSRPVRVFLEKTSSTGWSPGSGFQFSWAESGPFPINVERATSPGGPWVVVSTNNTIGQFTDDASPSDSASYRACFKPPDYSQDIVEPSWPAQPGPNQDVHWQWP